MKTSSDKKKTKSGAKRKTKKARKKAEKQGVESVAAAEKSAGAAAKAEPCAIADEAIGNQSITDEPKLAKEADARPETALENLAFRLSTTAESVDRAFARGLLLQFRLSIAEWRIIATLAPQETVSTADVIARTQMDRVRVSRAVLKLAEAGLITRLANPRDQRAQRLALTDAGRSKYPAIAAYAQAADNQLKQALSSKKLQRLNKALDALLSQAKARD